MKKHTPGPWKYKEKAEWGEIRDNDGRKLAMIGLEENAHLIAAAPLLLKTCERVLDELTCEKPSPDMYIYMINCLEAAIKTAKGY